MPVINIESFSGIMPKLHPTLLPDSCAVRAHNCRIDSGKLSPLRQPAQALSTRVKLENGLDLIANAKTLYLWKRGITNEFLAWPGIVSVAKSNIANDSRYRIFVTGETGIDTANEPCMYISALSGASFNRHSIVKANLETPVATRLSSNGTIDSGKIRYTFFFQTWVDEFGYESGASLPSSEIEYNDGDQIQISALVTVPPAAVKRRIYKVVTGFETDQVQFVYEQDIVGAGFPLLAFSVKDEDAGEVIPLMVSPPDDLSWMTYVPGNFYVGVSQSNLRTIMFSDVNRPTSWPDAYRYDVHDNFIGLAVTGNTVFVMTNGSPWIISGTAPESMTVSNSACLQSCVSARSICVMNGSVFYASQDGICMMSESNPMNVAIITEKYFGKPEWEALNPASCIMAPYDDALHCWFTLNNGLRQGYIIAVQKGMSAVTTHDEQAKAVFYDAETDSLYYVREV